MKTALTITRRTSFILSEQEIKHLRICPSPVPGDLNSDRCIERVAHLPATNPSKVNVELDLDLPSDRGLVSLSLTPK